MKPFSPADKTWNQRRQLAQLMFTAILGNHKNIDELSSWALGAAGGAAALVLANLSHLSGNIKPGWEWWLPTLLALSALAGTIEKVVNFQTKSFLEVSEKALQTMEGPVASMLEVIVAQSGGETGYVEKALLAQIRESALEVRTALPWFARLLMDQSMKKAANDSLATYRLFTKVFFWQVKLLVIQIGILIVLIGGLPFATHF